MFLSTERFRNNSASFNFKKKSKYMVHENLVYSDLNIFNFSEGFDNWEHSTRMSRFSSSARKWHRVFSGVAAGSAVVAAGGALAVGSVAAEGFEIHPPHFHWNHKGPLDQLDMKRLLILITVCIFLYTWIKTLACIFENAERMQCQKLTSINFPQFQSSKVTWTAEVTSKHSGLESRTATRISMNARESCNLYFGLVCMGFHIICYRI